VSAAAQPATTSQPAAKPARNGRAETHDWAAPWEPGTGISSAPITLRLTRILGGSAAASVLAILMATGAAATASSRSLSCRSLSYSDGASSVDIHVSHANCLTADAVIRVEGSCNGAATYRSGGSCGPIPGLGCRSIGDGEGLEKLRCRPGGGIVITWTEQASWTSANVDDTALNAVSCPSITMCVAVDDSGFELNSVDAAGGANEWTGTGITDGSLYGVSCPDTSGCVAVDGNGSAAWGGTTPSNLTAPSITGPAIQGTQLTEMHGTWTPSPTSYSIQWDRCNTAGASCSEISGAADFSYTLTSADVGSTIRVSELASNGNGDGATIESAQTAVVQAVPASSPGAPGPPPSAGAGTATSASSEAAIASIAAATTHGANAKIVVKCTAGAGATCSIDLTLTVTETLLELDHRAEAHGTTAFIIPQGEREPPVRRRPSTRPRRSPSASSCRRSGRSPLRCSAHRPPTGGCDRPRQGRFRGAATAARRRRSASPKAGAVANAKALGLLALGVHRRPVVGSASARSSQC
jgi:hypothetical protein